MGVLLLVLDLSLIVIFGIMGSGFRTGALIIGIIGLPLASYFLMGALRPAVIAADDAGVHLRRTFGSQHIPWEAVRAFHMESGGRGGPELQAVLHTGEVVWLPTPTSSGVTAQRIVAELTEALRERVQ